MRPVADRSLVVVVMLRDWRVSDIKSAVEKYVLPFI
jgi:hypothetical protein